MRRTYGRRAALGYETYEHCEPEIVNRLFATAAAHVAPDSPATADAIHVA
jgi:hypothetical protein